MAKISSTDLLDAFKEMTLLELSEFVKAFEETFDVKAAAPVAVAGVAAGRAGGFGIVVGVDRAGQADDLWRCGAEVVVDDLAELLEAQ